MADRSYYPHNEPHQFLFRSRRLGGHMHVDVWCGTPQQKHDKTRAKLGTLIMDPEQWEALSIQLAGDGGHRLVEFGYNIELAHDLQTSPDD